MNGVSLTLVLTLISSCDLHPRVTTNLLYQASQLTFLSP